MSGIVTPYGNTIDSHRRTFCRLCGLDYRHPKFGGNVVVANAPGQHGKDEIMFCQKCSKKEEAQEVYKEIMAIAPRMPRVIH